MVCVYFRGHGRMRFRLALSVLAVIVISFGFGPRVHAQINPVDRTGETIYEAVGRAAAAYSSTGVGEPGSASAPRGAGAVGLPGWVSEGTVTLFTANGPKATFDVTLIRQGDSKLQRIIHQPGVDVRLGTDGSESWHSLSIGMRTEAIGQPGHFIDSQTVRSVARFLDYENRGLELGDKGRVADARVVEARGPGGRRTDYNIDDATSMVTRLEFVTGEATDPFGNVIPRTETYLFSDFRAVDGIPTPFKVERLINGLKAEEMVFTSVSYTTTVGAGDFKP